MKIRKQNNNSSNGFDYLGSFVYINENNVRTLESASFSGGRINKTNNAYDINYFITDHLGSTRVIVDNSGILKAQYNYYPFGKQWEDVNLMANTNRYTFSGKEKQTVKDLGWLDFTARMLSNNEIPIFTTQDPLSEKYYSLSPYMYCAGNPVRYIDPDGMMYTDYVNDKGALLYKTDDGLKNIIIIKDAQIPKLKYELQEAKDNGTINDPETNKTEIHVLGQMPQEYSKETTKGMDDYWVTGYKETYEDAYKEGTSQFSAGQIFSAIVSAIATDNNDNSGQMRHGGRSAGISDGNSDREKGKINRLNPLSSLKNNSPLIILKDKNSQTLINCILNQKSLQK
jgi:RHS repeat-associated protein